MKKFVSLVAMGVMCISSTSTAEQKKKQKSTNTTLTSISKEGVVTPLIGLFGDEACKVFAERLSNRHPSGEHLYCSDRKLDPQQGQYKTELFMLAPDDTKETLIGFAVTEAVCQWAANELKIGKTFFFCDDVTVRWPKNYPE